MDVDSTLIQDEVIELLADEAGVRAEVAEITDRAMRGEIDFEQSLRERVSMLKGLPESVFERVQERIRLSDGARTLISAVHASGGRVGAVSGGFNRFSHPWPQS
jgi:phosphoserine phosphatase